MNSVETVYNKEAIAKLKTLVDEVKVCLFRTDLKINDIATCNPMTAVKVCDQGNIWFFSEKNSEKNTGIKNDKNVQLYFSHPAKNIYLVVSGEATIIYDKNKIAELWTSAAIIWFKDGKDDPNISLIKVKPTAAFYWDTNENKMISFLKMIASVVTGTNLEIGTQVALDL